MLIFPHYRPVGVRRMAFSVTKYVAIGSLCAIVFLGGFALWSVCVTLSGAVIAWGHVALMGHNHAVQHPTGGQVADLWVKEGDIVQMGAPLLRLDGHAQNVQLDLTEGHLFEIMARRARLVAERDDRLSIEFDQVLKTTAAADPEVRRMLQGQVQLFKTHLAYRRQTEKKLQNQAEQIALQIEGLSAQAQAAERQLALLGDELETQLSLRAKGLADRAELSALQQQEAALLGKIAQLSAKQAEAQTQLHEIERQVATGRRRSRGSHLSPSRPAPAGAPAARRSPPAETRAGGPHPYRAHQRVCPWIDHFRRTSGRTTGQANLASCAQ